MVCASSSKNRLWLVLGAALLACAACTPMQGALRSRAAFDLSCPDDQLELHDLGMNTQGVRGCGKQATYVWMCSEGSSCAWVMNSAPPGVAAPSP